jgi:hypothetical protein
MPVEAVANEHRMYVALAAVAATVVLGVATIHDLRIGRTASLSSPARSRAAFAMAGGVILFLVILTQLRNEVYGSITGVWIDTLRKDRESVRAYYILAIALDAEGDHEFAKEMAAEAIRRRPQAEVFSELARHQVTLGNLDLAENYLRFGYDILHQMQPPHSRPLQTLLSDLATVLSKRQRFDETRQLCEDVLSATDKGMAISPPAELTCSLLLADICKRNGDLNRADALSNKALDIAMQSASPVDAKTLNAVCLRADVLLAKGNWQQSHDLLGSFVRALRSVHNRTHEQQHFLDLFVQMLRDSAANDGAGT